MLGRFKLSPCHPGQFPIITPGPPRSLRARCATLPVLVRRTRAVKLWEAPLDGKAGMPAALARATIAQRAHDDELCRIRANQVQTQGASRRATSTSDWSSSSITSRLKPQPSAMEPHNEHQARN
jgi:hypothetical protein